MDTTRLCISVLTCLSLCCVAAAPAHAKRTGPKAVAPVKHAGVKYVVKHWSKDTGLKHNGGYLEAQDAKTGKKLWSVVVYHVEYTPDLERDVQDVFITTLKVDKANNRLIVDNEKKHAYWVDLAKRTATHVIRKP